MAHICSNSYSYGDWCKQCQDAYDEWCERDYAAHVEGEKAAAFYAIPEATDLEWQRHLDDIAPLVGDQAVDYHKYTLRPIPPGQPLPRRNKPYIDSP